MIVSFIVRLSLPIDPAAIIRRVISVRVDTVDCERFPVSVSDCPRVERRKIVPFLANTYPSFSVQPIIGVILAITPCFNAAPDVIKPCVSVSMLSIRSVLIDYHSLAPNHL